MSRVRLRYGRGALRPDRVTRLEAFPGWVWDPFTSAFDGAFNELKAFVGREGHARVAAKYTSPSGFRLGQWVSDLRKRHDKGEINADRIARLEAVPGWTWDPFGDAFRNGLFELQAFAAREGSAQVPSGYVSPIGFPLGQWTSNMRDRYRRGTVSATRVALLEAIAGWTWSAGGHDVDRSP